jgi:hypothetical protein
MKAVSLSVQAHALRSRPQPHRQSQSVQRIANHSAEVDSAEP